MAARVSHYKIPDDGVFRQICFSGGRTSAYLLWSILDANGGLPENCEVIFTNTGREFEETLEFVEACSFHWNVPITWLEYERLNNKPAYRIVNFQSASRNGEPFEALILAKSYLPNVVTRFCTIELKIRTSKRYLLEKGIKSWVNILGIRADEQQRVKRDQPKERWSNDYPLFDSGVSRRDVADFWRKRNFDLRLPNINGRTPLGNCDGCFLKSEASRAALARNFPNRYQWWINMERAVGNKFIKSGSYYDLMDFVTRQHDFDFDEESLLCQAAAGECLGS